MNTCSDSPVFFGNGMIFIHDNDITHLPATPIASEAGVVLSAVFSTPVVANMSPADGSYNNDQMCSISFTIAGASNVTQQSINVVINGVSAVSSGDFVNGYSGNIVTIEGICAYNVTITPSRKYPNYVNVAITIGSTTITSYFKTSTLQTPLLTTAKHVTALASNKVYIFAATSAGLDVIDIRLRQSIGYVMFSGGFNNVWCKQSYDPQDCLYLGTSNGVYSISLSSVLSGQWSNLLPKFTTVTIPSINSNTIVNINGHDGDLVVLNPNKVQLIVNETTKYSSDLAATISSGCCCVTPQRDVYYTDTNGVHVKYEVSTDWITPDYTYSATSTPSIGSNIINAIFAAPYTTESVDTSFPFGNTLFIGTANGLYVINENRGGEATSSIKSFGANGKTYNILQSDTIVYLKADPIEFIDTGRIYVGDSSGHLYILSNKTNTIIEQFTVSSGNFGEFLNDSTITALTSLF